MATLLELQLASIAGLTPNEQAAPLAMKLRNEAVALRSSRWKLKSPEAKEALDYQTLLMEQAADLILALEKH